MILRDPGERHADHIGYGQPQFGQDGGGFILQCFVDARTHESGSGHKNLLRSEEHTSELQSLMRISYAVFCLKKKTRTYITITEDLIDIQRIITYTTQTNT